MNPMLKRHVIVAGIEDAGDGARPGPMKKIRLIGCDIDAEQLRVCNLRYRADAHPNVVALTNQKRPAISNTERPQ